MIFLPPRVRTRSVFLPSHVMVILVPHWSRIFWTLSMLGGFCMMSLPVWLSGPMFPLGREVSVPGPMFLLGGLCPGASLSGGVCPGGVCVWGVCLYQGDPQGTVKSGRYASYWNAFLLVYIFPKNVYVKCPHEFAHNIHPSLVFIRMKNTN